MKYPAVRLATKFLVGALGVGMAAGCVNARDEYVDYGSRIVDANNTVIDGMIVSVLPDINGEFFLANTPDLPEKVVFKLRMSLTFTPVTENTGTVSLVGQPLDFETNENVGGLLMSSDVVFNSDASFDIPVQGTLPARANPVTVTMVPIDLVVHGQALDADFLCGTLTGTAGALDLQGSTWGAPRVAVAGGALPPQVLRCEDAPSE